MGFWGQLANDNPTLDELKDLSEDQCKAIIDALTLALHASGEVTFLEKVELETLLHRLPWSFDRDSEIDAYTDASIERAASRTTRLDRRKAAEAIAAALPDVELRKTTLRMTAELVYADWHASHDENEVLELIGEAFEIPAPFISAIIEDVAREITQSPDPSEPIPIPRDTPTVHDVLSQEFLKGFFSDLYASDELRSLSEDASYAFVDALTVALVADGYPEPEELQEFKRQLELLPFTLEDVSHIEARVEISITSLQRASNADFDAFVAGAGKRIPSASLREKALEMAVAITHADFDITDQETHVLGRLAAGLDVAPPRLLAMIEHARSAGDSLV